MRKIEYFKFISYSFAVGFLISSWFYFYLFLTYGSFTAFNANPKSFSFSNQDLSFYFSSFESFGLCLLNQLDQILKMNLSQYYILMFEEIIGVIFRLLVEV